ncbi:hypothetical protein [Kurthia massiliensis]|uniref:hypothetical protein n=1 Tax=Kurthia massiliensis TaxID=1033739 RepID=UPI000288C316|nr:hypothetical protein [Kurthia massiliensis]
MLTYNYKPEFFKQLSNFKDVKEFNTNYEMFLADHANKFTKSELNFLRVYKRYAAKVVGVVTAKIKTVVDAALNQYKIKTSVRTAKRALKKAVEIGLVTLHETKSAKTGLKAPNIAQFNKYNFGTTLKNEESHEINVEETKENTILAPHKTNLTKASINKYYIRKGVEGFKSIAVKMTVKKDNAPKAELLTQPVKPKESFKPLRFISRLKDVVYNSLMNTKDDVQAIKEIVFGNVYSLTKFPMYKPMTDSLLEKALRIVEMTLQAHKLGALKHIKSMRGFIDSRIKAELQAVTEKEVEKVMENFVPETAEVVVEMYSKALESRKVPLYDWLNE